MRDDLIPRWVSWLIAVVGLGILVAVIARSGFPAGAAHVTVVSVAILVVSQLAYLVTESLRLQSILQHAAGMAFDVATMFRIFVMARILNLVVPQSGNVYRIAALKDEYDAPVVETAGGLAAFVWISVSASLALSTILLVVAGSRNGEEPPVAPLLLAGMAALAVAAPSVMLALATRMRSENTILVKVRRAAVAALDAARHPRTLARFLGWWLLSLIVIVIMYSTAFSMVGPVPSVATLIALYALVQATSFIVITPGNIGIQDLGFAAIAVAFGSDPPVAAAAALLIRISGIAVIALVGIGAAWAPRRTRNAR